MVKDITELMKPRIKVIGDYPDSPFSVGDILFFDDNRVGGDMYVSDFDRDPNYILAKDLSKFPHLFQPLQWHQARKFTDLPEYIKWTSPGSETVSYFKVENWYTSPNEGEIAGVDVRGGRLFIKDCLPATKKEFESFLTQKQNP